MPDSRPLPLWAGRTTALLGIILVSLNLRTAVAAISPITTQISVDVPLDSVTIGVLGMIPPIAFALSGIFAPMIAKRIGLEQALLLAAAMMVVGPFLRGLANDYLLLLIGSIISLGGIGMGNILLPPAVKRYFPDRVGLVTSLYVTMLSVSTALPAILAVPIADAASWRLSLGVWGIVAFSALVPWVFLLLRHRRERAAVAAAADEDDAPEIIEPPAELVGKLWHSRVAWSIALAFATSALGAYSMFAWLPQILIDDAATSPTEAGALLALYGFIGLPFGLIVPILATRMRNIGWLVQIGVLCFIVGYLGLLFAPQTLTWLWVLLAGSGPLLFPVCLVLINLRTRTTQMSIALSGFAQSIGYGVAATGPLIVGLLHGSSGSWTAPIVFLLLFSLLGAVAGLMLAKPRFVEDDLDEVVAP